jgi:hypothetical protein
MHSESSSRINVGILIFGDPTRNGSIMSEVKFLKVLYDLNSTDCDFTIITVNPSVTKRVLRDKKTYSFPHRVLPVFTEADFGCLNHFSALVTYPGHSNFFGGYLNDNVVKMYKMYSYATNTLKIPVYIRVNDSEIKVRDYRKMSEVRLQGKEESAFMKDPLNVAKARDLVMWNEWDYDLVYWLANGSKESCDWVAETLYDREDDPYRMASRQRFVDNTVYLSDDVFFLVRKNFESRKALRESIRHDDRLCYIGFFDTVNGRRAKAFDKMIANDNRVPFHIFGKGTEILEKVSKRPFVQVEEGFIVGDSDDYFKWLASHLAYVFVGKGNDRARYIGKTVYDAVVAGVPVLCYRPCDKDMIAFKDDEFYFDTPQELYQKWELLKDSAIREDWVKRQSLETFSKLPESTFRFSQLSKGIECPEDLPYVDDVNLVKTPPRKKKMNSKPLFD